MTVGEINSQDQITDTLHVVSDAANEEEIRREICISVFKGWSSDRKCDAAIPVLSSQLSKNETDPIESLLNHWLRGGLNYSTGQAMIQTRKTYRWTALALLAMFYILPMILILQFCAQIYGVVTLYALSYGMVTPIILVWVILMERYFWLPKYHEPLAAVAQDLAPRFRTEGWDLEYVVENEDSPTGVAVFFRLTPIAPSDNKYDSEAGDSSEAKALNPLYGQEEWVSVRRNDYIQFYCQCCTPSMALPHVLRDAMPTSLESFIDVFLWGAMADALADVNIAFCQRKRGRDIIVALLSIVEFFCALVAGIKLAVGGPDDFFLLLTVATFVPLGAFVLTLIILSSCSDAQVAHQVLHPECRKVVETYAPHFLDKGYHLEYVSDEQPLPRQYRLWQRAGMSYLRLVPKSQSDVKIPDKSGDADGMP